MLRSDIEKKEREARPYFDKIMTLSQASRIWQLDRKTIYVAGLVGHIYMEKKGGTWVVFIPHMIAHYGDPALLHRLTMKTGGQK